jgi:uncharacterized protein YndB with AHSA1/START domain
MAEKKKRSNVANNTEGRGIVITRIFDAPRELMWKAWTDPERLKRWWGPKNFTSPFCKNDFRVGGKYLYCMRSPDGQDVWSTGVYREIVPLERIVYTDSFADEKGNVVPATYYSMSTDFPLELQVNLTFEEKDDKTKMTLSHVGIPEGQMRDLTEVGWNESFDKLAKVMKYEIQLYQTKEASKGLIAKASIAINSPIDKVWDALVNPDKIKHYMFGTNTVSDWKEGSPIAWKGEWEGKKYEDKGVILKLELGHMIQYSHFSPLNGQPDVPENYHIVTIELSSKGKQTHLSLQQDKNATEEAREHSEMNWNMMLGVMKKFLEK